MTRSDYDPLTAAWNWLAYLRGLLAEPGSPFWWPTLIVAVLAFAVIGLVTRASLKEMRAQAVPVRGRAFLRQAAEDFALFATNSALPFLLAPMFFLLSAVGAALAVALLTPILGSPEPGMRLNHPLAMVAAALIPFMTTDFSLYWTHRLFHRFPLLWRAHRLHHEPVTLTPLTAFRFWPQEQIIHIAGGVFMNGLGLGIVAMAFGARVDPATLLGVNAFTLVWNLAFSHLRHSHVALPFPRWLSYVLVSPHMHQAHHSADAEQHDKNFATVFALWDWMFGTLYLPRREERFRFGVDVAPSAPGTPVTSLPAAPTT
ncbi:sterol desaturase family protein [Roseomonas terrae]|jgi:sterol desaturase/sphingolipid hydroxylase (fatty acid hydroxylase superfamily)|uniref:Sterol desaturase family protein n=1 Tax=Neoroseomonas terrae TaxID=424799 RepID=A0ABS5EH33_9PROT|nr:sterol desaturase family protein [Neoroseomonas terrae]MBR0650332.1 sterol desaturase family protein [Neoroseomonas terrae]